MKVRLAASHEECAHCHDEQSVSPFSRSGIKISWVARRLYSNTSINCLLENDLGRSFISGKPIASLRSMSPRVYATPMLQSEVDSRWKPVDTHTNVRGALLEALTDWSHDLPDHDAPASGS